MNDDEDPPLDSADAQHRADDRRMDEMAALLDAVAEALHGGNPKDGVPPWIELPEIAKRLREQVARMKEGFEGCCPCCEPVGETNKRLQEELETVQRMSCFQYATAKRVTPEKDPKNVRVNAETFARCNGWVCFKYYNWETRH